MAEQNSEIYRKSTLDRLASPEQLNDYLRVTNPGVWAVICAVIIMLAGMIAWSAAGKLETTVKAEAFVSGGSAVVMTADAGRTELTSRMTVRIDGLEYRIAAVESENGIPTALLHTDLPDGRYDAVVVTESITPIEFIFR